MADLSAGARILRPYKSNKGFLDKNIKLFLEKCEELSLINDEALRDRKYRAFVQDENMGLMNMFYNIYFDENNHNMITKVNLSDCFDIDDFAKLEKTVYNSLKCHICEGVIAPNGDFYPAKKSHYCLCAWLNLNGVDIRGYVRSTVGGVNKRLFFSDLFGYSDMDDDTHFNLTEQQVKAMFTLLRLHTKDAGAFHFHNVIEESYKCGFCDSSDAEKTRKQIRLFEDVLGKKVINSNEILSSKENYYS